MDLVKAYEINIADRTEKEKSKKTWGFTNSGLYSGDMPMAEWFVHVVPEGFSDIRDYIEETLKDRKGRAKAVELGGIGSQLFSEFTPGFFNQTVGVTLADNRFLWGSKLIEPYNHSVVEGNIFKPETREKVKHELGGDNIDVLITRMIGGVSEMPRNLSFLGENAIEWLKLLADGGIIFAQIPRHMTRILPYWMKQLDQEMPNTFETDCYNRQISGEFRLHSLTGIPKSFPMVGVEQIQDGLRYGKERLRFRY